MDSKDIKTVVDANEELELGGKVTAETAHDTDDDGTPGRHEARSRSNGNEAGDGAGAETDGAPLLLEAVVEEGPGDAAAAGGEVGHVAGHDGADVHGQGRAAVEAEPTDPEEDGAEDDVGDVVGSVGEAVVAAVPRALAEHEGVGERAGARRDVDGAAAGEVVAGQVEEPAVGVPGPVGDGVVDDGGPDEDEDDGGEHAAAISNGTDGEGGTVVLLIQKRFPGNSGECSNLRDGSKHSLVETEENIWQHGRAIGLSNGLHETKLAEITKEGVSSAGKGQRVAPEEPLEPNHGDGHHR